MVISRYKCYVTPRYIYPCSREVASLSLAMTRDCVTLYPCSREIATSCLLAMTRVVLSRGRFAITRKDARLCCLGVASLSLAMTRRAGLIYLTAVPVAPSNCIYHPLASLFFKEESHSQWYGVLPSSIMT